MILSISENTGVTDLAQDPQNPDILYAASYQRRRHVWTLINGGPESAIYKSTDAGATWNKLRAGLPAVELGRIGLAISPVDSNVIYAIVEAADRKGGIFRSSDRGGSWERRNEFDATAMYYARIVADPTDLLTLPALALAWWLGRRELAHVPLGRLAALEADYQVTGQVAPGAFDDVIWAGGDAEAVDTLRTSFTAYLEGGAPEGALSALRTLRDGPERRRR